MQPNPDPTPDDLSPEWTAYDTAWAVRSSDFGGPVEASRFLLARRQLFKEAQANGIPKEMLTPFEPNKPGFADRVAKAFAAIATAAKHAAE